MPARRLTLALCLLATAAMAGEVHAEHRQKRRVIIQEQVYAPGFFEHIPGVRTLFGDYALTEEEYNALYGPDAQDFDESYYEPEPAVPVKPKNKPGTKEGAKTPAAKPASKPAAAKAAAKPAAGADETETASTTPDSGSETPSTKPQAGKAADKGMSCEKASGIVSGYGFSAVTPQSCAGKVYAFNASRGGKTFAIKLDPASGELTEVKKLQ